MPIDETENFGGGDETQGLYKVGSQFKPTAIPDQFVGEIGDLFYSTEDTRLRISDGETPGGLYIIPDYGADILLLQTKFGGDVLPDEDLSFDIGSPTQRFDNIYGNNLILEGNLTVNGTFEASSTITDKTIILSSGAADAVEADGSGVQVDLGDTFANFLYDATEDSWTINKPLVGNVTGQTSDISNHFLYNLADVDTSTVAPTDGQALVWDDAQQLWVPGTIESSDGGSGGTGSSVEDVFGTVDLANLSDGDVIVYDEQTDSWITTQLPAGSGDPVAANEGIQWATSGTSDQYRISDLFVEDDTEYTIREIEINNDGKLQIELATFSPVVSATGQSLKWDQPASQFNVSVNNPDDFLSKYIASVGSITNSQGVHTSLSDYTTSGPSEVPDGGVDWTQGFFTNTVAEILSDSQTAAGGSASATIVFQDEDGVDWPTASTINYSWGSVGVSISFSNLTGNNFLQFYNSVDYTVSVLGLNNQNNASSTVTAVGGNVSSASSSGTLTFTDDLHKDNNSNRSVLVSTEFGRPHTVTGSYYTVELTDTDTTINANFTYPSFYIWTASTGTPPVATDIISGSNFDLGEVTLLGNQSKSIDTVINNSESVPRAFWFAVRSTASQPSVFKTGASAALLSDVGVTTGYNIDLEPHSAPASYVAEEYTLYGITLQPGETYVRIS